MICGSSTPPFYYGFMCDEDRNWGRFYLIQVWSFSLIATALTLYLIHDKERQWIFALAYIIAGYSTLFGCIHLAYYQDESLGMPLPVWPWLGGGTTYAFGAIIYALKIPERFIPKTFDIWLHSHSIFHWMILAAAMIHFWASLRAFHERQIYPCPETGKI